MRRVLPKQGSQRIDSHKNERTTAGAVIGATMFVIGVASSDFDAGIVSGSGVAAFMAAVTEGEFTVVLIEAFDAAAVAAAMTGAGDDNPPSEPERILADTVVGVVFGVIVLAMLMFIVHSVAAK